MVERFNRSLLQLLRSYVEQEADWEQYLSLVLFAYRTATHTSTGASPFLLMFGRQPKINKFNDDRAFDIPAYEHHLQAKLANLKDFVDTNLVEAAQTQKSAYDHHVTSRKFTKGDLIWLSIPTGGKLSPRWEGGWRVEEIKTAVTMKITDGHRSKVVHVNRVRHRYQLQQGESVEQEQNKSFTTWSPPEIEHSIVPVDPPMRCYPLRDRHPPDRLRL